jgi:uncharacterized protein (DUF1684 family)
MPRNRLHLLAPTGIMLALVVGCGQESSGVMSAIPPPEGWEELIAEERAAKDEAFRTDPETPLLPQDLTGFEGLEYWPLDRGYYFVGRVNLYFEAERFKIVSSSGKERPCEKVGWVGFALEGRPLKLQVYRLLDSEPEPGSSGFFLPFMDGTTGQESYPAGRYVDLVGPAGGPYVLDFNTAYNPLCAYGSPGRYVCPVTPSENRLVVRIEAGERGYKKHEQDRPN